MWAGQFLNRGFSWETALVTASSDTAAAPQPSLSLRPHPVRSSPEAAGARGTAGTPTAHRPVPAAELRVTMGSGVSEEGTEEEAGKTSRHLTWLWPRLCPLNAEHPGSPVLAAVSLSPGLAVGHRAPWQTPAPAEQAGSTTCLTPNTQRSQLPWAPAHSSAQTSLHDIKCVLQTQRASPGSTTSHSPVPQVTEDRVPSTARYLLLIARTRNRTCLTTPLLTTVTLQVLLHFCSLTVLGAKCFDYYVTGFHSLHTEQGASVNGRIAYICSHSTSL